MHTHAYSGAGGKGKLSTGLRKSRVKFTKGDGGWVEKKKGRGRSRRGWRVEMWE